ncbi:MAG: hypothetical protein QN229_05210 [Desulfurococcaceae archaeon TW002]
MSEDNETYYELYGEYISLRELGITVTISTILALVFYSVASYIASGVGLPPAGLMITFGAIGASVGFVIGIFVARVKRVVKEV